MSLESENNVSLEPWGSLRRAGSEWRLHRWPGSGDREGIIQVLWLVRLPQSSWVQNCGLLIMQAIWVPLDSTTKYHKTGRLIDNRNLFPTDLDTGKFKVKVLADLMSPENQPPQSLLTVSWWGGRGAPHKGINPIHEDPTLITSSLPKAHLQETITRLVRIATYECRGPTFRP